MAFPLLVAGASHALSRASSSLDSQASGRRRPGSTDLLDLLSTGSPAAFASDQNHRIIFWNKGAERVMERRAGHALGRLCHDVFAGRDLFGNRFCSESCPVSQTINRHEGVNRFEMRTGDHVRPRVLGVTVVEIPDRRRGFHTAVHILDQIEEKSWLAREVARLREAAAALLPGADDSPEDGVPIRVHLSLSAVARTGARGTNEVLVEALSDRERDVLRAIASGQANRDNVHTKLEAMALFSRNGWNLPPLRGDDGPPSHEARASPQGNRSRLANPGRFGVEAASFPSADR